MKTKKHTLFITLMEKVAIITYLLTTSQPAYHHCNARARWRDGNNFYGISHKLCDYNENEFNAKHDCDVVLDASSILLCLFLIVINMTSNYNTYQSDAGSHGGSPLMSIDRSSEKRKKIPCTFAR
jgi:hypothetical protein